MYAILTRTALMSSSAPHVLLVLFLISASLTLTWEASVPPMKCSYSTGHPMLDKLCAQKCAPIPIPDAAKKYPNCPRQCTCVPVAAKGTESCATLDFDQKTIREDDMAGTPIFTIPIQGQEKWTFRLGRSDTVDGSIRAALNAYIQMNMIGNNYEIVVNKTLDLEDIFHRFGIQLNALKLILTCSRPKFPNEVHEVILLVEPVNEFAPVFLNTPLIVNVTENTVPGTEIFVLNQHAIDFDMNPTTNELAPFRIHEYSQANNRQRDGRAYFTMNNPQIGGISLMKTLDFEALAPVNATVFHLNVSSSDVHGLTTFTVLTIYIQDVDDLPPEFFHPGCPLVVIKTKPCLVSYHASVPVYFSGQITNIIPGSVSARDMDSLGSSVEFFLEPGPGENLASLGSFSINRTTGVIIMEEPINVPMEINLVIVAHEISPASRSTQASLKITVFRNQGPAQPTDESPGLVVEKIQQGSEDQKKDENTQMILIGTICLGVLFLMTLIVLGVVCMKLHSRENRIEPSSATPFDASLDPSLIPSSYRASMHDGDTPKQVQSYAHASDGTLSYNENSQNNPFAKENLHLTQKHAGPIPHIEPRIMMNGDIASKGAAAGGRPKTSGGAKFASSRSTRPPSHTAQYPPKSQSAGHIASLRSIKRPSSRLMTSPEDDPVSTASAPAGKENRFNQGPEDGQQTQGNMNMSSVEHQDSLTQGRPENSCWHQDCLSPGDRENRNHHPSSLYEESESNCANSSPSIHGDNAGTSPAGTTPLSSPERRETQPNTGDQESIKPKVQGQGTHENGFRDEKEVNIIEKESGQVNILSLIPVERASLVSKDNSRTSQSSGQMEFLAQQAEYSQTQIKSESNTDTMTSSNIRRLVSDDWLPSTGQENLASQTTTIDSSRGTFFGPPSQATRRPNTSYVEHLRAARHEPETGESCGSMRSKSSLDSERRKRRRKKRNKTESSIRFDLHANKDENTIRGTGSESESRDLRNERRLHQKDGAVPYDSLEFIEKSEQEPPNEEDPTAVSKQKVKCVPIDKSHRQPYMLLKYQASINKH